ncbi:FAD-binding domain-containing protein [Multifurca ochricompacta]|uniref:FAD-binding domain-containing protein n=1 Tax=Multifurca ochricompacta TaxID=376703 RepID=A0AAD4M5G0_9AGAM|nr:FAD-binding domain-containing protein [Multifurca ochricompacta]
MLKPAFLGYALVLSTFLVATVQGQLNWDVDDPVAGHAQTPLTHDYRLACEAIAKSISPASQVFHPGSLEYNEDISHWANSSSEVSACSVRPGTPHDVGLILHQLAFLHTPFAVTCSGHATNPGFSSTRGVHISLVRFNDIVIHEDSGTVDVGAGLTWSDLYSYIVPRGLNVVGGRLVGVGLAGFTLGGGYSWKSSQYGLTEDTVTAFELVLPNGEIKVVTEKDEDLFFALKGGMNNYGIVTKFTFKTHKQTDVWAAVLGFAGDQIEPAYTALADFLSKDHDHKATQLGAITYSNGTVALGLVLFYDGPKPPDGLYDDLLKLPNSAKSIIEGSFTHFVSNLPLNVYERVYFDSTPVLRYTAPFLKAVVKNLQTWGDKLSKRVKDLWIIFGMDPFASDYLTHGGPSAWPPDRSEVAYPSSLYFGWSDKSFDKYMYDNLRKLSDVVTEAAIEDGQDVKNSAHYPNYALYGTSPEKLYGDNLKRLRKIRKRYDPFKVMHLTGGFKI